MERIEGDQAAVLFRSVDRHIAWITLNRPARRNAVDGEMARALGEVVRQVESDPDLRVAVLTGAGDKAFCAGGDLRVIAAGRHRELFTPDGGFAGIVQAHRCKPWIAAVNGAAVGGGLEIVLACDMVVAASDAVFGLPEVSRGLLASGGGALRLSRRIARAVAIEMLTTGRSISSARAVELGLVNRSVASSELEAEVLSLAASIAANSPLAVQAALAIARADAHMPEAALWQLAAEASDRLRAAPDSAEGPKAFLERRAAQWEP